MRHARRLSTFLFALSLFACEGDDKKKQGGDDTQSPVNQAPTADAFGPTEVLVGDTVTLDASKSSDADGDELKFLWTEDENNPPNNALDGVDLTAPKITFTVDQEGSFTYKVRVRDGKEGGEATAEVTITVASIPENPNAPTVTGITVNGKAFLFADTPFPVVFTTATANLSITVQGTDTEDDAAGIPLVPVFSGAVSSASVQVSVLFDPSKDADGFASFEGEVSLRDTDGLVSPKKKFRISIVPHATSSLLPQAIFVNCEADAAGDGSIESPYQTIQAAVNASLLDAQRPDIYVASGVCEESVALELGGFSLYGLFDPTHWRRRTGAEDISANEAAANDRRFASPTIVRAPDAQALFYTSNPSTHAEGILIDGFSFEIDGTNRYGVAITTPSGTIDLQVSNNEFVGTLQEVSTPAFDAAAVLIYRDNQLGSSTGKNLLLRNLFRVSGVGKHKQVKVTNFTKAQDAGQTFFYSNVFMGPVTGTNASCNGSAGTYPSAFCFYVDNNSLSSDAGVRLSSYGQVGRNLFWVTDAVAGSAGSIPSVVSAGCGRMNAWGNIVKVTPGQPDVRFAHTFASSSSSANYSQGSYVYNAFLDAANLILLWVTNTSMTTLLELDCLIGTGFGNGACGTNLTASGTASGTNSNYQFRSDGSLLYDESMTVPGGQTWRIGSASYRDKINSVDWSRLFNTGAPHVYFDFDGRYGPHNDEGATDDFDYNIGPFEPGAPMN